MASSLTERLDMATSARYGIAASDQKACHQCQDDCAKARHRSSPCYPSGRQNGPDRVRGGGGNAARANIAEQRCGGAMTAARRGNGRGGRSVRSEEHTSKLQSLMRTSYDVFR